MEWFGIVDGYILSNYHRVIALDSCGKLVFVLCTFFGRMSSNFVYELIFRKSGLGL